MLIPSNVRTASRELRYRRNRVKINIERDRNVSRVIILESVSPAVNSERETRFDNAINSLNLLSPPRPLAIRLT